MLAVARLFGSWWLNLWAVHSDSAASFPRLPAIGNTSWLISWTRWASWRKEALRRLLGTWAGTQAKPDGAALAAPSSPLPPGAGAAPRLVHGLRTLSPSTSTEQGVETNPSLGASHPVPSPFVPNCKCYCEKSCPGRRTLLPLRYSPLLTRKWLLLPKGKKQTFYWVHRISNLF